ncbi:hypothetical protein GTO89_02595 [Heliobacterium gestii]|uniref:Uncharacterized protein n=1 Tax=Heliomicrobium gestii TaxID=2699 RepID=A0A845L5N3_HELGE|nr:CBO0543 family protein [Heliomicrobium gestii]MBM7865672.1 hypothetical protein [Heliomicrobium gestii]MZP41922.1 hypothetical protein [Heliomicrobium gestii]
MTYYDQLQAQLNLWQITLSRWNAEELYSISWWSLIGVMVIAYAIWWKIVDKKSLRNILLFGSFIAVANTVFDSTIITMGLWGYKTKLIPTIPSTFPFDYTVIPLLAMTIYQFFPTWDKFFVGIAIVKAIFVFGVIPLLVHFQIMALHGVNLFFVYAGMVAIPTAAKFVIDLVIHKEHATEMKEPTRSLSSLSPIPAKRPGEDH